MSIMLVKCAIAWCRASGSQGLLSDRVSGIPDRARGGSRYPTNLAGVVLVQIVVH